MTSFTSAWKSQPAFPLYFENFFKLRVAMASKGSSTTSRSLLALQGDIGFISVLGAKEQPVKQIASKRSNRRWLPRATHIVPLKAKAVRLKYKRITYHHNHSSEGPLSVHTFPNCITYLMGIPAMHDTFRLFCCIYFQRKDAQPQSHCHRP